MLAAAFSQLLPAGHHATLAISLSWPHISWPAWCSKSLSRLRLMGLQQQENFWWSKGLLYFLSTSSSPAAVGPGNQGAVWGGHILLAQPLGLVFHTGFESGAVLTLRLKLDLGGRPLHLLLTVRQAALSCDRLGSPSPVFVEAEKMGGWKAVGGVGLARLSVGAKVKLLLPKLCGTTCWVPFTPLSRVFIAGVVKKVRRRFWK